MNKNFKIKKIDKNETYQLLTTHTINDDIPINTDIRKIIDDDGNNDGVIIIEFLFRELMRNPNMKNEEASNLIWYYINYRKGWKMLTHEEKIFIKKYSVDRGHSANFFQAKYNMLNYIPANNKVNNKIRLDKDIFEKLGSNLSRYIYTSLLYYLPATTKKINITDELINKIGVDADKMNICLDKMEELKIIVRRNNEVFFN
ncbi:hypothetical protein [Empedobacter stercoris]|uniref:hypothetical protein n=1 Tax=Empedobacter stercoris TaxID=1628248 RepID=UPI0039E9B2D0